jgi:hypothetical protein
MRASGKPSAVQLGGAVGFKAGALGLAGAWLIPRRGVDQSRKANRVQSPSGSRNARWRREPDGGNTDPPETDPLRVSVAKHGT